MAYRLDGPLFFAAAHQILLQLTAIADVRVLILRMARVTTLDTTGAHVLGDALTKLEQRGITVMLSGITDTHRDILSTLGVAEKLRAEGLVFADTPSAINRARLLLDRTSAAETTPALPHPLPQPQP